MNRVYPAPTDAEKAAFLADCHYVYRPGSYEDQWLRGYRAGRRGGTTLAQDKQNDRVREGRELINDMLDAKGEL